MKIRGLVFIALVGICVVIKLLAWAPFSSHLFIAWQSYGDLLADLVFYGILASVLGTSKERIWIVVIAWATFLACLAEDIEPLTGHHFFRTDLFDVKLVVIFKTLLYVSLLFARQGPLQALLRWLAIIPVIPLIIPHLSYPKHHVPAVAVAVADTCITLLQYILLIDIIRRTPELQSAEGIDFP
jgi:hypothetical protein